MNGNKIIVHVCNDAGAWGRGFVIAISNKWKEPEEAYRNMKEPNLGQVEFIKVSEDIIVANIIGQHKIRLDENGNPPIRYDAIRTALKTVNDYCTLINATIHAPRFGCGLAGGNWNEIEKIIHEVVNVPVYIYDLK